MELKARPALLDHRGLPAQPELRVRMVCLAQRVPQEHKAPPARELEQQAPQGLPVLQVRVEELQVQRDQLVLRVPPESKAPPELEVLQDPPARKGCRVSRV